MQWHFSPPVFVLDSRWGIFCSEKFKQITESGHMNSILKAYILAATMVSLDPLS